MLSKIKLDNGKYEVIMSDDCSKFEALRYGESWRELIGDNLVYFMFMKIKELELEIKQLIIECLNKNYARYLGRH